MHVLAGLLLGLTLQSLGAVGLKTLAHSSAESNGLLVESGSLLRAGLALEEPGRTPRPSRPFPGTNSRRERAYEEEDESFEDLSLYRLLPLGSLWGAPARAPATCLVPLGVIIASLEHLGGANLRC
jgi:hypothetical protein